MDDLARLANDSHWDDESTKTAYLFPLKISAKVATHEGLRLAIGNPADETYRRGPFVCAASPETHIGPFKWAVDFLVPDGTPVLAARSGFVMEIQQGSNEWGNGAKYRDLLNYVTVKHADDEYSQYCHLGKDSVAASGVRMGDIVQRGQQIAVVGKTGWTDRDHLHFCVFRIDSTPGYVGFKSLRPIFKRKWL